MSGTERGAAFRCAAELFRDCYLEANADDLIAVADWLITGSADTAVRFGDQRARNYAQWGNESPDAARWTEGHDRDQGDQVRGSQHG